MVTTKDPGTDIGQGKDGQHSAASGRSRERNGKPWQPLRAKSFVCRTYFYPRGELLQLISSYFYLTKETLPQFLQYFSPKPENI